MCGICGIYNFERERKVSPALLGTMTDSMIRRGPDTRGTFIDAGIGLGVRRLSIIDIDGGTQPITNEDGSLVIVFNGEIYNHRALRDNLEAKGHTFKTRADTEAIIHAFEEYGPECVDLFRGMFAFAIWDKKDRTLFLARDRLGIKPLYYYKDGDVFVFASEIKAVLLSGYAARKVNVHAVDEFLSLRYVIEPNTIFKDIFTLPPGRYIRCNEDGVSMQAYWNLSAEFRDQHFEEGYYINKVQELFNDSINLHLISDVPVGAYLSGGIDSSSIVAAMQEKIAEPVKTFSVGYPQEDEKYSELGFAKIASRYIGTEHHEVLMRGEDFVTLLLKHIWHQEQPLADASLIPYHFISEYAHSYVKVMLSGVGGDEFFFGYEDLRLAKINAQFNEHAFLSNNLATAVCSGAAFLGKFSGLMRLALQPVYSYALIRYFQEKQKKELYSGYLLEKIGLHHTDEVIKGLLMEVPARCTAYQKVLYLYVKTWLATNMLQGTDKATMASSIEQRVPFLDHKLVEFLANVPYEILIKNGRYKHVLKKIMEKRLPREILERKKMGFQTPEIPWFGKYVVKHMKEVLLDNACINRGYFNRGAVDNLLCGFKENNGLKMRRSWLLYNLEMWHRIFIDEDIKP